MQQIHELVEKQTAAIHNTLLLTSAISYYLFIVEDTHACFPYCPSGMETLNGKSHAYGYGYRTLESCRLTEKQRILQNNQALATHVQQIRKSDGMSRGFPTR